MGKILIVEDEKNISKLIEDTLLIANYQTECSYDGIDALTKINANQYDLIIMDIMLPKLDGFQILEKINNLTTPIIFLSAKNDVPTIIRGLKVGIDYMTKPFEPLELLARIELRIKKVKDFYKYKNISLNNIKREVFKDNEKINLSPKEFDLLLLFFNSEYKVIKREEILNKVWGIDTFIETRTLDYHIGELRKKLDLKEDIITIPTIGYRLKEDPK